MLGEEHRDLQRAAAKSYPNPNLLTPQTLELHIVAVLVLNVLSQHVVLDIQKLNANHIENAKLVI